MSKTSCALCSTLYIYYMHVLTANDIRWKWRGRKKSRLFHRLILLTALYNIHCSICTHRSTHVSRRLRLVDFKPPCTPLTAIESPLTVQQRQREITITLHRRLAALYVYIYIYIGNKNVFSRPRSFAHDVRIIERARSLLDWKPLTTAAEAVSAALASTDSAIKVACTLRGITVSNNGTKYIDYIIAAFYIKYGRRISVRRCYLLRGAHRPGVYHSGYVPI